MVRNLRELYKYRALLWSLTVRELRARYRASVLGFLWTFLNPTLNMMVYAVVFGVLLTYWCRIESGIRMSERAAKTRPASERR